MYNCAASVYSYTGTMAIKSHCYLKKQIFDLLTINYNTNVIRSDQCQLKHEAACIKYGFR